MVAAKLDLTGVRPDRLDAQPVGFDGLFRGPRAGDVEFQVGIYAYRILARRDGPLEPLNRLNRLGKLVPNRSHLKIVMGVAAGDHGDTIGRGKIFDLGPCARTIFVQIPRVQIKGVKARIESGGRRG